jgi:tetratricopeptide (TPR) repeat protein
MVLVVGVWSALTSSRPNADELLTEAKAAFQRQKYDEVEQLAARIPSGAPASIPALVLAGDAAARQKRFNQSILWYQQVPEDGSSHSLSAMISLGLVHKELGHAAEAEIAFRKLLQFDPRNLAAHNAMAHLLGVSGRSWEALPHLLEPVRQGQFSMNHLLLLGSSAPIVQDPTFLDRCQKARPDNQVPFIGRARQLIFEQQHVNEARRILEQIVQKSPDQSEAQVRLGWILLDSDSGQDFLAWHQTAGDVCVEHPELWAIRATWEQRQERLPAAIRCYWECLRRDPDHQVACYQLGLLLERMGQQQESLSFLERASLLTELGDIISRIQSDRNSLSSIRQAAEICERLGRFWEAWGWSRLVESVTSEQTWVVAMQRRLHPALTPELGSTSSAADPAKRIDLTMYPLPDLYADFDRQRPDVSQHELPVRIHFRNVAADIGLSFTYFNGANPEAATARMYEFTGGGAAAIDYDGDHWPDLCLTQGSQWLPDLTLPDHTDRLFRNIRGQLAIDVSERVGLKETGFSQGITTGDYDNDGFVDLYIANIGGNQFFKNNGDGTFSDVTGETGTAGNRWTTSCLLADLNGDFLPDLYTVNYLSGDDVFTRVCTHANGIQAGCGPEHFQGARDQIYLNQGDGRFAESHTAFSMLATEGKGMGILAADFDHSGGLQIFVANDAMANFWLKPSLSKPAGDLIMMDHALPSGLAFDWQGQAQAGMGVAGGDIDGNGLPDLFVTNYYREANTLYLQRLPGLFDDSSRAAGLAEPSYLMLGFGTQFLDADLDGFSDIVIANGHVHNLSRADVPFRMPPQLFHNSGHGQFVPLNNAGDYFEADWLGRGLARLDWNRDGRDDFVVSHLYAPAALVLNESQTSGQSLAISLRGVRCSRDAIGATLQVTSDGRQWVHQLMAGDGYQAANERKLIIGLGSAKVADEIHVRWPDGEEQTFSNVTAGSELMLIQGRSELYLCGPGR